MQRDTVAVSMRQLIPILLKSLDAKNLSDTDRKALTVFEKWDFSFEEGSHAAPLAYAWFKQTEMELWGRLFPERKTYSFPPVSRTIEVLADENSVWFDNPGTVKRETRAEIVFESFRKALNEVVEKTGTSDSGSWTWAKYRPTDFGHSGKIPGLGHDDFAASGMEHSIFANTGVHGPVWKMVVAVGTKPRAFGVYPGGQSGDLFGPHAEDFLAAWRDGEMKELQFMLKPDDANSRKLGLVQLVPKPNGEMP